MADDKHTYTRAPANLSGDSLLRGARVVEWDGRKWPGIGPVAVLSELGRGGMGVVYHGMHTRLAVEVAVKVLPRALLVKGDEFRRRFVREARLAARLRSPHIVSVLDVDHDAEIDCEYFIMEYVHGMSAAEWSQKHTPARGADGFPAYDIVIGATRGLVAAHAARILHRDVKPGNIILPYDDGGELQLEASKLADLGLAVAQSNESGLTTDGVALGTPGYLSPEQALDAQNVGPPTDVFSMGATLYALLARKAPFAGSSTADALIRTSMGKYPPLESLRRDVSKRTLELVEATLQREPGRRPPDAATLLERLLECRDAVAASGASVSATETSEASTAFAPSPSPQDLQEVQETVREEPPPALLDRTEVAPERDRTEQVRPASPPAEREAEPKSAPRWRAPLLVVVFLAVATVLVLAITPPESTAGPDEEDTTADVDTPVVVDGGDPDSNEDLRAGGSGDSTDSGDSAAISDDTDTDPDTDPDPEAGTDEGTPPQRLPGALAVAATLSDWDAGDEPEQHAAGAFAAERLTGFTFAGLESVDASRRIAVLTHAPTGLAFVLVPGSEDGGAPAPYLLARTEVTQAGWDAAGGEDERRWKNRELPIESVSWFDARAWCDGAGLRLPTASEWEHAARAGSRTAFCYGDDPRRLAEFAWTDDNSRGRTRPVGGRQPNGLGLFDVHGNVFEWCADRVPARTGGATDDAVYRGGSWDHPPALARLDHRSQAAPDLRSDAIGLRPACSIPVD